MIDNDLLGLWKEPDVVSVKNKIRNLTKYVCTDRFPTTMKVKVGLGRVTDLSLQIASIAP
jgi:hypothetical protein